MGWTRIALLVLVACAKASVGDKVDAKTSGNSDGNQNLIDSPVPIDAFNCSMMPCSIVPQCGCGGTMSCDVDTTDLNGTACRAVTMMGHETNTCSALADCDKGYVCLGPAGGASCKKYCATNADCVAPRGQCVIDITDGMNPIPGLPPVCSSGCDPTNVAAGGCPANFKCGLFTATHMGTTYQIADCSKAGTGVQTTNCKVGANGDDTLCGPNTLCTTLNAGTNWNCRRICNRGNPGTTCSSVGSVGCIGFNPPATIGGVEYGVCQ